MTGEDGAALPVAVVASRAIDTRPFFHSKRAAAILKHALLIGYLVPYASKTGSASPGNRVAIVDGYAGAGRYDNGDPGSPALIATAARSLQGKRAIECFFVERNQGNYERLQQVLNEEDAMGTVSWEAWRGTVEEHLQQLLARAEGIPLLLFLDPFGLGLPFDVIVNVFSARPSTQSTEVLFRFDAGAIRRIRGVLHADSDYPARAAQLVALDRAAGGSWWRTEDDPSRTGEQYTDWFIDRLLGELCRQAHCSGWTTEVKQRKELQPVYYLIFLTRHTDGMEVFGEALSLAQEKWRQAVFDDAVAAQQKQGQQMLLDPGEMFKHEERQLAEQWGDRLEQNLRGLLRQHESFVVRQQLQAVLDGVVGLARSKHLRAALKRLQAAGLTTSDSKGTLWSKTVVRAPGAQI